MNKIISFNELNFAYTREPQREVSIDSKNKINQLLFSEEDSKYYVLLQLKDFYEIVNLSLDEITSTILSNDFINFNKWFLRYISWAELLFDEYISNNDLSSCDDLIKSVFQSLFYIWEKNHKFSKYTQESELIWAKKENYLQEKLTKSQWKKK